MWPIRLRHTRAQEGSVGRRPAGMGKVSPGWGTGFQVIGYSPSGTGSNSCELAAVIHPAMSTPTAYSLRPVSVAPAPGARNLERRGPDAAKPGRARPG